MGDSTHSDGINDKFYPIAAGADFSCRPPRVRGRSVEILREALRRGTSGVIHNLAAVIREGAHDGSITAQGNEEKMARGLYAKPIPLGLSVVLNLYAPKRGRFR